MFPLPLWLIFSILQGLTSNAFNFLSRYVLRGEDDSTAFAWFLQLTRFVVFFTTAILFNWKLVINTQSIFILLLIGLTECIATYLYMKMHVYSELSISTILSRTRMLWIPVFAFFIVGEHLRLMDYIGIAILFLGVSLVSSPKKMFVDRGAKYANIAAIIIALNIVLFKFAIPYASSSVLLAAFSFPSILILPFFMKNARKRILINMRQNVFPKFLAITLNIISLIFFAYAMKDGEASKVNAVYQGMLVFSVLAGIIFLHERTNITMKLIGTFITIIGVIMLSLY